MAILDFTKAFDKVPHKRHIKGIRNIMLVLMSTLVSSIVVHGHVSHYMNESVIVPIIKDKNKRVNVKNNYRPICLCQIYVLRS